MFTFVRCLLYHVIYAMITNFVKQQKVDKCLKFDIYWITIAKFDCTIFQFHFESEHSVPES